MKFCGGWKDLGDSGIHFKVRGLGFSTLPTIRLTPDSVKIFSRLETWPNTKGKISGYWIPPTTSPKRAARIEGVAISSRNLFPHEHAVRVQGARLGEQLNQW